MTNNVIGAEAIAARRAKVQRENERANLCNEELDERGAPPEHTPHICGRPAGHDGLHRDPDTKFTWLKG